MQTSGSPWGEEESALCLRLWKEGLSAKEVATRLGTGRSRNSVIGHIHRKGEQRGDTLPARVSRPVRATPPRVARAASPPRNMHVTRIKPVPAPEKKPNKFDDTPASRAAMALLGQCYSADERRAMFWGSR